MTRLQWSDALSLDMPAMDDGHRKLVELLDLAHEAEDAALVSRWRDLVQHTARVFEREDRWMEQTQFGPMGCHAQQHDTILQVMREGLRRGRDLRRRVRR